MLKELLKKFLLPIRLIFWLYVFLQLNALFVLVPYRNAELMSVFNKHMETVKQYCNSSQYRNPNFFTTVRFGDLSEEIAYCQHKANGFVIVFDKSYWNKVLTDSDKKQVMMHEIVHCIFKQKHINDPRHFMAEFFEPITDAVFEKQVKEYLTTKCNK